MFLHENNRNYNSYRFSCKFAFTRFLFFLTNENEESGFQQVGSGNEKYFCFLFIAIRVLLQSHAEFNRLL